MSRTCPQCGTRVSAELEEALKPLAAIADEYDADELDECRPHWVKNGSSNFNLDVELYEGRGGKPLLTLRHAMQARFALTGKPFSEPDGGDFRKAAELYTKLYTGGTTWDGMSDERRAEYVKKAKAAGLI